MENTTKAQLPSLDAFMSSVSLSASFCQRIWGEFSTDNPLAENLEDTNKAPGRSEGAELGSPSEYLWWARIKGHPVTGTSVSMVLSFLRQLHICLILPHLSGQSTVKTSQRLLLISYPLSDWSTSGSGCDSQSLRPPCATFKPFSGEKKIKIIIIKSHKYFLCCFIQSSCFFVPSMITGLCPCPSPYLLLLWLLTCHQAVPQDLRFQLLRHLVPHQSLPLILSGSEGSVLGGVVAGCAAFASVVLPPIAG